MALGVLESDLNYVVRAIDNLRLRKARPNLPGLSRYLFKHHNFSSNKTVHLLDILIAQNKVKEIIYKNNISFRNMLNWREPIRPCYKKLETHINSSIVVSTMHYLQGQDRDAGKEEGIEEARLEAALIEQLDGAVKLQEIRKQIHLEVRKSTIVKNKDGYFVLGDRCKSSDMPKENSDSSSDTSESADVNDFESTNDESLLDSTSNVETPTKAVSSEVAKPKLPSNDRAKINAIKNLEKCIENVVKNLMVLDDSDEMEKCMFRGRRKHWEITSQPVEEPVEEVCDNKRRRIIRKKTIYDPSEFELTPLVRKKRRGPVPGSIRRGRGGRRPRVGRPSLKDIKEESVTTPPIPDDKSDSASTSNSVTSSPREKQRCRGRPPSHINKKCCICSAAADKTSPSILSCILCLNIAHKNCVKNDSLYEGSNKWRCEDCNEYNPVVCSACEVHCDEEQVMLMCDYCEEFYHAECHYPPVKYPLLDPTWRCSNCPPVDFNDRVKIKVEVEDEEEQSSGLLIDESSMLGGEDEEISACFSDKGTSPPHTSENTLQEIKSEDVSEEQNATPVLAESLALTIRISKCDRHKPDEPIPLVDDWTAKQVSDYFLEKFDQDVADAFLSQEIDGKLLKQISRQYVTDDLGLQFGIALKVLYYVKKIQLGTNLLHELWTAS